MSTTADSYPEFFRRRTLGRAPSPPTWACYEQIPYEDDYSDSGSDNNSCSEDEEDYDHVGSDGERRISSGDARSSQIDGDMEIDEGDEPMSAEKVAEMKKDVKGKQRAIESRYESPQRERRKKHRQPVFTLRPILTIQKSQGFVWNQVSSLQCVGYPSCLLMGPRHSATIRRTCLSRPTSKTDVRLSLFIRSGFAHVDRRVLCVFCPLDVASTSPSNPRGFVSSSVSSTNSSMMDYEVEVVEIRVREGELNDIIP